MTDFTDEELIVIYGALVEYLEHHGCKGNPAATSALGKLNEQRPAEPSATPLLLRLVREAARSALVRWVNGEELHGEDLARLVNQGYVIRIGSKRWTLTSGALTEAVRSGLVKVTPTTSREFGGVPFEENQLVTLSQMLERKE